jgi:hypothetical protein
MLQCIVPVKRNARYTKLSDTGRPSLRSKCRSGTHATPFICARTKSREISPELVCLLYYEPRPTAISISNHSLYDLVFGPCTRLFRGPVSNGCRQQTLDFLSYSIPLISVAYYLFKMMINVTLTLLLIRPHENDLPNWLRFQICANRGNRFCLPFICSRSVLKVHPWRSLHSGSG